MKKELLKEIKDELWDYIIDIEFILEDESREIDKKWYNGKIKKIDKLIEKLGGR